VRKVSLDTRARPDSRANQAHRGLREPKGIGVIRAYRVRLGQRVRREIVAHKDLRESQPLPNGAKAAGASTAPAASPASKKIPDTFREVTTGAVPHLTGGPNGAPRGE
jgi:hypothetical protein